MELCLTLDMIRDYVTKELQGSQFPCYCNIIIGIHEDDIPSYNAPGIAFLEQQKVKVEKHKEEAQKDFKLAGD